MKDGSYVILICLYNSECVYLGKQKSMSYTIALSQSDIDFIHERRRKEKDTKLLRRYQCLFMLHEQYPKKEIAKILGVNIDTVTDWIKIYNKEGLAGLGLFKYEGRRPSSLDKVKNDILSYVRTENISKLSELQMYLENKFGLKVEHSWLSRYCKKNSISLIKRPGWFQAKHLRKVYKLSLLGCLTAFTRRPFTTTTRYCSLLTLSTRFTITKMIIAGRSGVPPILKPHLPIPVGAGWTLLELLTRFRCNQPHCLLKIIAAKR